MLNSGKKLCCPKKRITPPPLQVKWSVPKVLFNTVTYLSQTFSNLLFTAITSLNFMGIAFSKPLYSKKFEIMPYLS